MERAREMKVRVYPTGPVGQPIAGYVAEVGEPLTEVAYGSCSRTQAPASRPSGRP